MNGQRLGEKSIITKGAIRIDDLFNLETSLNTGIYLLQAKLENGQVITEKMVIL